MTHEVAGSDRYFKSTTFQSASLVTAALIASPSLSNVAALKEHSNQFIYPEGDSLGWPTVGFEHSTFS